MARDGILFLKEHIDVLKNKRILVFGVGAAPCDDECMDKLKKQNLKGNLEGIPFFYCRGEWDEELFTLKDKLLINILKKVLSKKDKSTLPAYAREMVGSFGEKQDWTDKENLNPIINYVKK